MRAQSPLPRRGRRVLGLVCASAVLGGGGVLAGPLPAETFVNGEPEERALDPETQASVLVLDLCDNGDFELPPAAMDGEPFERIPWWRPVLWTGGTWDEAPRSWPAVASLDPARLPRVEDGVLGLFAGGALLAQPIAGYGPLAAGTEVRGRVRGAGRLILRGADGVIFETDLAAESAEGWREFVWTPPPIGPDSAGLLPRFEVALGVSRAADDPSSAAPLAWFDDVEVRVPLVGPDQAALEAEVAELVVTTLDQLLAAGLDRAGPRATHFWVGLHDVDTGAPVGRPFARAGLNPLHGYLLDAVRAGLGERAGPSGTTLGAHLVAMATEFLELCVQPDTHLPRRYDPLVDLPVDHEPLEVAAYLGFLIDLAGGRTLGSARLDPAGDAAQTAVLTTELQARAFTAAVAMGRALLDVAVLPDGTVAALVRPSDGWVSTSVVHLRRLDVPAQLVRLAALCRARGAAPELQALWIDAAREAVFEVEYAHYWPGTWKTIDPGFDDSYGHIGARSATMAVAWPEEPAFERLALSGRARYLPLWRNALYFGGSIAADQVRCWEVLAELETLEAGRGAPTDLATLLAAAARLHFKGEATFAGGWLDITVVGFDPAILPVGDVVGLPQNALAGLATVRQTGLGLDPAATRAFFATLLAATRRDYQATFGFDGGGRTSAGSIRILPGLIGWL